MTLTRHENGNHQSSSSLGNLADPEKFRQPIEIEGEDGDLLIEQLRTMLLIRMAEEKLGDMVEAKTVRCPAHLGIGQEAVAVGVSAALRPSDRVFGAHRSHSHFLAVGGEVERLFAEVLGRSPGASHGMGGSMHLFDGERGFLGSVPIVAASVPIAVGAGLAAKMDNGGDVAVSYFGDGAIEEGVVHESLNLAATMNIPVLFVCENNLFSSHMHISLRQPADSVARFAHAHQISAKTVDGNDVVAVARAARQGIERARQGGGPFFIEAVTYRWRGHVGHREDLDVGVRRGDELGLWKERDPVERLARALESEGLLSSTQRGELESEVREQIAAAWKWAEDQPFPDESALLDLVYAEQSS